MGVPGWKKASRKINKIWEIRKRENEIQKKEKEKHEKITEGDRTGIFLEVNLDGFWILNLDAPLFSYWIGIQAMN